MDFLRYAETGAALVNSPLADVDDVRALLVTRPRLERSVVDRDPTVLRRFSRDLRQVFEAADERAGDRVVELLNGLLDRHPITPRLSAHDGEPLHLHVRDQAATVAEVLVAEALLGLANVCCDLGTSRLGCCEGIDCDHVFVDASPNRSRRYCSERCASRANAAAYRARKRQALKGTA